MKILRLIVPTLAGLALAVSAVAVFAGSSAAPASPPPLDAQETNLLPAGNANKIHLDGAGKLWITEVDSGTVRRFDPGTGAYTLYTDGTGHVQDAQVGPDGNLWWIKSTPQSLARMDIASRLVTTWPISTTAAVALTFDSSQRVWLVDAVLTGVYRFNPTSHEFCEVTLPDNGAGPGVAEHDGAIWVGDTINNRLGEINPATNVFTYWPLAFGGGSSEPVGLTFAANGDVWWADQGLAMIGRLEPGANNLTLYGPPGLDSPQQVAYHAGKVWFTDPFTGTAGTLGVIDPALAVDIGSHTQTPLTATLPLACSDAGAGTISTAAFTDGVSVFSPLVLTATLNTEGNLYQFPTNGEPYGLAFNNFDLWVTDAGRDKLVRVDTAAAHLFLPLIRR